MTDGATGSIASQKQRLIDLLKYIEATEQDRLKTILDFVDHKAFRRTAADLNGLPGVALNSGSAEEPVWLRVDRLPRTPVPTPQDRELALWVVVRDDVRAAPTLKTELAGSLLVAEGLISAEDAPERVALADYARREALDVSFALWRDGLWAAWAATEMPRRETIALYNALFMLRHQLEGVSDVPVELVCGIGITTLHRDGHRLRYPLLTVQVEINLDEASHAIELRPRMEVLPGIEIDTLDHMGLSSLDQWRSATEAFLLGLEDDSLSPFLSETFAPVLRNAVALLDPDALYVSDVRPAEAGGSRLSSRFCWSAMHLPFFNVNAAQLN